MVISKCSSADLAELNVPQSTFLAGVDAIFELSILSSVGKLLKISVLGISV